MRIPGGWLRYCRDLGIMRIPNSWCIRVRHSKHAKPMQWLSKMDMVCEDECACCYSRYHLRGNTN